MTNQQLFEKINKLIQKEMKLRQSSGKLNRNYNEKNNGIWLLVAYRKGNNSQHKKPHLEINSFVDNMNFEQLRRVCVDMGGEFYVREKQGKENKKIDK